MKAQELSHKYAAAVFSRALETWITTLRTTQDALSNDAQLMAKLQESGGTFSDRQRELDKVVPEGTDQQIRNFLYFILKEGDIALLDEVLGELDRMTRGGPQVQVAQVTTSLVLSDSEKEQFRQKLRAQYGENLEFMFTIDSAIVGGVIVQIGDKIIDGSVSTRLEAMRNLLGVKTT